MRPITLVIALLHFAIDPMIRARVNVDGHRRQGKGFLKVAQMFGPGIWWIRSTGGLA